MDEDRNSPEYLNTPVDLSAATIRSQLLWSSLFPLAIFGLLSILVISSVFDQLTLNLVSQRNKAQVEGLADELAQNLDSTETPLTQVGLNSALQSIEPVNGSLLLVTDANGHMTAASEAGLNQIPLQAAQFASLTANWTPSSQLLEAGDKSDKVMVSFAPLRGKLLGLVLIEPWTATMLPSCYYQLVVEGLIALGIILSLVMLSLGIGRTIRPIAVLIENATKAVPGSIFHPIPENGPKEIRALTKAFNLMVIRLAEQQSALRQYAFKALLSQEEERQRLSRELHDGTLQDLVGLSQRVELCRNELQRNPIQASHRLEELQRLLEQTIDDVRRISYALRPPVLDDFGLVVALESLCKDLKAERPDLHYDFKVIGKGQRLQPDLELAVYRVVQEALANIRKHVLNAKLVEVELIFREAEIRVKVKNDGAVFTNPDVRSYVRSGHLGLAGMYERARLFGGSLTLSSDPGENTVLELFLPFAPVPADDE